MRKLTLLEISIDEAEGEYEFDQTNPALAKAKNKAYSILSAAKDAGADAVIIPFASGVDLIIRDMTAAILRANGLPVIELSFKETQEWVREL